MLRGFGGGRGGTDARGTSTELAGGSGRELRENLALPLGLIFLRACHAGLRAVTRK